MSWQHCEDPVPGDTASCDAVDIAIVPRTHDIGGFEVRRALPSRQRRMVGPFIFWDQMGPSTFAAGNGIDVRPPPHIGLSTLTYLFDGAIHHRDSLGTSLTITPGSVNWMTAGRGIVHSERSPHDWRNGPHRRLYGIQSWVALPKAQEERDPGFAHYPKADLPVIDGGGFSLRVVAGALFGKTSPVATSSDLFYGDIDAAPGAVIPMPADHEERAVYVAEGEVDIAGDRFGAGQLLILHPGTEIPVAARAATRMLFLGGEPMDGPRHIWWNLVSSSKERIEQAKEDWKQRRFDTVPGDEEEFIPLPER